MKQSPHIISGLAKVAAAGVLLGGLALQAAPTIVNIYPDGLHQFEAAGALTFQANSTAGVTNVSVALTVTSLAGNTYLSELSGGNGLTITGSSTGESVSAPLASNTIYKAVVQVTDATGALTTTTVSFDTITPSYVFEAEDWDYTSSGGQTGQFIDNPQTNQYAAQASTEGADYNNASPGSGGDSYRPQGMETETTGDVPRLPYVGTTNIDYDVGFGTTGGWANYTRHYPVGLYNVYARYADGGSAQTDTASMSVVGGNAQLIGSGPFTFGDKITGWQTYAFYPLLDANKNLVQFTNDGTASTIQVLSDGGSYNANFYMFVPADTNPPPTASISFSNMYPNGATQFQPTNTLAFNILSPVGVNSSTIVVQLTGTSLLGTASVQTYSAGNGLTISGESTNLDVTCPLSGNTTYSAFIQGVDSNGTPSSVTVVFDTITPLYTFEAEDYDYDGGLFVNNPQTNAYDGLSGEANIDYYVDDPSSGSHDYRYVYAPFTGVEVEGNGDIPRQAYTNAAAVDAAGDPVADYDVGFNDPANWENYTRNYPDGTFNVFLRGANGGGGNGSANLQLVTGGETTTSQTVSNLGTFTVPSTGNWQSYTTVPAKDASGNLVKVTFSGGGPETLRISGPNSENANYYMLEPADTTLPVVSGLYPNGTYMFQRTNKLSFSAASSAGIATSGIVLTLNGSPVGLTFAGSSDNWNVSYPDLQPNMVYSAAIAITTLSGLTYNQAFTFDTYSSNYYTWECADYDYTSSNGVSGLFFDNPQFDMYNGLTASQGIDEEEQISIGAPISEDVYRPSPDGSTVIVCTQGGGDIPRLSFGTNATWRINWFGYGDFCNYTRHYPAGSYNVLARFTEGGGASSATLWDVTSGEGTTNQATSLLGTFWIPLGGWGEWAYQTLVDSNMNPVTVTFDGSKKTLQLGSSLTQDGQTINAGFFMLIPAGLSLTGSVSAGEFTLSFASTLGSNYQVEYKNNLTDSTWSPLGAAISGTGSPLSVQYSTSAGASQRFYRVMVQ